MDNVTIVKMRYDEEFLGDALVRNFWNLHKSPIDLLTS